MAHSSRHFYYMYTYMCSSWDCPSFILALIGRFYSVVYLRGYLTWRNILFPTALKLLPEPFLWSLTLHVVLFDHFGNIGTNGYTTAQYLLMKTLFAITAFHGWIYI
ncbi:hypothetical protein PsorP6_006409 [Peronosclerospora sorghi]|uniref:Uncharacterized protein n=1 Tax=Peronosclerospora sorghi TaxID=230839 RepID=A0ACC0W757_9STRA|nr:hypothetical protein PsorP6_006409 [Peronosclerospora sorghi]